jgi:hypothetical protein
LRPSGTDALVLMTRLAEGDGGIDIHAKIILMATISIWTLYSIRIDVHAC